MHVTVDNSMPVKFRRPREYDLLNKTSRSGSENWEPSISISHSVCVCVRACVCACVCVCVCCTKELFVLEDIYNKASQAIQIHLVWANTELGNFLTYNSNVNEEKKTYDLNVKVIYDLDFKVQYL